MAKIYSRQTRNQNGGSGRDGSDAETRGRGNAESERDAGTRRRGDAGKKRFCLCVPVSPRLRVPASPNLRVPASRFLPGWTNFFNRAYETVTDLRKRLEESWIARIIAQSLPNVEDALQQSIVCYCRILPDVFKKLFLCNQPLTPGYQVKQNLKRLLTQVYLLASSPHTATWDIDLDIIEAINRFA